MSENYYVVKDNTVKRGDIIRTKFPGGTFDYLVGVIRHKDNALVAISLKYGNIWSDNYPKEDKEGNTLEELEFEPKECTVFRRKENA